MNTTQQITFANSFLEYLVALIAFKPLAFLLDIILLVVADSLGYTGSDMDSNVMVVSEILSAVLLIYLATKVVQHKLKKKAK